MPPSPFRPRLVLAGRSGGVPDRLNASRTEKTAHRKRRTCKAEEIVLGTQYVQVHFFYANVVRGGYRSRGIHATWQ